jgi:hypothetical protein
MEATRMNLQDIVGYGLGVIMFLAFAYLAWASRQEKNQNKGPKDKIN